MKARSIRFTINLAPRDPFFESILGRVLRWALTVGRYLVIFTELIVIISFATRFTLDRQVTDLNEALNQKKLVIMSYGELESQFRTVQSKVEDVKQVGQQVNIADMFPKLTAVVPKGVELAELSIDAKSVYLSGAVTSQQSLNDLLNNMQLSKDFTAVNVDKIESRGEKVPGFIFELRAGVQGPQVAEKKPAAAPAARTSTQPAKDAK